MRLALVLRLFVLVLAGTLVLVSVSGRAAAQAAAGLPAVIDVDSSGLEAAEVQAAIEHELHVRLVIDATARDRLEVSVTGHRANVTYNASGREPVMRSVDLPHDHERALETIAFLAGNLARDEASELLAQLAPATEPDSVPRPEAAPTPKPTPTAAAPPAPPPKPEGPKLIEPTTFAASASVYYPLTALKHTEQRRLNLEVGLAYSWVGAIHGAGMTLGYFRSDGLVEGFSAALGWNRSGPVRGIQFGGLVSEGHDNLRGVGFGTLVNLRDGDTHGIQGAFIFTRTHLAFGLQASTVLAMAREVQGIQVGLVTSIAGPVQGAQVGIVTVAKPLTGAQLGLVNVAASTHGMQAGLVNVAGPVHGFQLGLVNVAGEIHGGALGLVSIAKNGRLQPTTWLAGPNETVFVGLKSVTDLTYSLIGVGYEPSGQAIGHQETVGMHLELPGHFFAEPGGGYGEMYSDKGAALSNKALVRSEVRFDARVGFEVIHGVTPFVAGSVTKRIMGHGADVRGEYLFGVSVL
jgi:hypothetical protein